MVEYIKQAISDNYSLNIGIIKRISGGWTADAYIAKSDTAEYFVKVYDKRRPSIQPWIARIDTYMPITLWLYENTLLRNWMIAPLFTSSGEYKVESGRYILMLFPMLRGITIGETPLDAEQIHQLAAALAELHSHGMPIPLSTDVIQEDYSLPFLQNLIELMGAKEKPIYLQNTLRPYESSIQKGIKTLQELSAILQNSRTCDVLCHTDIHGWNLMWTNKMVLIDWEGLRLAPAEADLFAFTDGFFFDYACEEFLSAYRTIRRDYVENQEAMLFYRLRRRVEDIAEFAHSIGYDNLPAEDIVAALQSLQKECIALSTML